MSGKSVTASDHASLRQIQRSSEIGNIEEAFHKSVNVSCEGYRGKLKYHSPSNTLFVYAESNGSIDIITTLKIEDRDRLGADHVLICDRCNNMVSGGEDECYYCGCDSLTGNSSESRTCYICDSTTEDGADFVDGCSYDMCESCFESM